jgi:serine/threonine-protein kinase
MILFFSLAISIGLVLAVVLFILWVNQVIFFRTFVIILTLFILLLAIGGMYFSRQYVDSLPEVKIPKVEGLSLEKAQEIIQRAGLKFKLIGSAYHPEILPGRVVLQKPQMQRTVKMGSTVKLILSRGSRRVRVPDLVGKDLSQARAVLRENGIILKGVTEEAAADKIPGTIIAQSISAEAAVAVGSLIYVTVAKEGEGDER